MWSINHGLTNIGFRYLCLSYGLSTNLANWCNTSIFFMFVSVGSPPSGIRWLLIRSDNKGLLLPMRAAPPLLAWVDIYTLFCPFLDCSVMAEVFVTHHIF